MALTHRAHVMFKMTGQRSGSALEAVSPLDLRPALLAPYRDLTSLRYDFPLVLAEKPTPASVSVFSLSGLIDRALQEIAQGDDGERVSRQVLQLERRIRTIVARGATGSLSSLWQSAADDLRAGGGDAIGDSLDRAWAAIAIDGDVVDCDAGLPGRLLRHLWTEAQKTKAARLQALSDGLVGRLTGILRADFAASPAGRTAAQLKTSVGSAHGDLFDFDAMSRVLTTTASVTLADSHWRRIREVVDTLTSQNLQPPAACVFTRCSDALAAWRERLPKIVALARALAVGELEAAGEFRDAVHPAFFDRFGEDGLNPEDLSLFPDILVTVNAAALDPAEHAALMDILSAGLPIKVLVQWDDLFDESPAGGGHLSFSLRGHQLAHMAMALNEVYVLQATGAHLFQCRRQLSDAMAHSGSALVNVFSGATGHAGDAPPYLVAAAAMASRAFPAFSFDPSRGADWASRFGLDENPQVERDWPVDRVAYEDDRHQKTSSEVAFTLVDFAACDLRASRHFARVPRAEWNGHLIDVPAALAAGAAARPDAVPALLMIDGDLALQKVIVDDKLIREARRCREVWHSLQELGQVRPPSPRSAASARQGPATAETAAGATASTAAAPATATLPAAVAPVPDAPAAETRASDDPYIETPRCSTCNECTRINPNMFAYNENKQAYVKNADAGTYAELVEAAESCQLAIIHPGKPRNPNEPGLADLIARAEVFQGR
jgi:ferredoxin